MLIITFFSYAEKDTLYIKNKSFSEQKEIIWKDKVCILQDLALQNSNASNIVIINCKISSEKESELKFLKGNVVIVNTIFENVSLIHNTDGNTLKVEKCTFNAAKTALNVRIGSKKDEGNLAIIENKFIDCAIGINFRAQSKLRKVNFTQNISCNDFIKTPASGNALLTAIQVEQNTTMADIGNCPLSPLDLINKPAGNEIKDPTNTMRSIWNLGSSFEYRHWNNENITSINSQYYQYPYFNVNFINCLKNANDNTCIGSPGILDRPISGGGNNEAQNKGYAKDSRYKNNPWFKGSNLGEALPNPATNQITIPVAVSEEITSAKIIIYNSMGTKPLVEQNVLTSGDIHLDVSKLASGMYFYSLLVNNAVVDTKKLIIRK